MAGEGVTRRRFLVASISGTCVLGSGLGLTLMRASSAWARAPAGSAHDLARTLHHMAQLLYPQAGVPDDVYAEVVDEILQAAASDPQLSALLDQGVAELERAGGADFFRLDEKSQLEVMQSLQHRPFFAAISHQVLTRFCAHPQVGEVARSPGPTVQGGQV